MSNWKKDWKTLYQTDSEWLRVKKDGTKPTLEVAQEAGEYKDDDGFVQSKFEVFSFDVERLKLVSDPDDRSRIYLVPEAYDSTWPHPLSAYEEWFAHGLGDVAKSIGENPVVLAEQFVSKDPRVRAGAYIAVGVYHGFVNFDGYPLLLTEPELDERWG